VIRKRTHQPSRSAVRSEDQFALRESRRRYRDTFDRLPFGIVQHMTDGRVLQVNETLARILGFATAGDLRKDAGLLLEELAGIGRGPSETHLRDRGGEPIPVRAETREIRGPGGSVLYRETRVSDLRDGSRLEARASKPAPDMQDYRRLFERVPLPMWVYDRETLSFLAVNEAAVQAYGYSPEEFLGMTILDVRVREEIPRFAQALERASGDEFHAAGRHRRKDGSVFMAEVFSRSFDFAGRPARLALSCDITRRQSSEERLRRSAEELNALSSRLASLREEEGRAATDGRNVGEIVADRLAGRNSDSGGGRHERLSEREFRVFRALAAGRTMTAIARELSVSVQTISTYRARIFQKMDLHSREDLVRYAAHHGLID
jgi:PAS domain S-box-containing protein